jgi:hypothetical protein
MPRSLKRDDLVARLIRAGELEVSGEDQTETDSFFDTETLRARERASDWRRPVAE